MDKLSLTALGVAMIRAMETRRPDRLFSDPYAQGFLDAMPGAFPASTGAGDSVGAAFAAHAVLRTRFYDDHLLAAGCGQVVLLAAGLDTRAYRLAWPPGTRLFEVDLPGVLDFKARVLDGADPACDRTAVPADLRGDWRAALGGAGFDPGIPTAWLAEGLLVYLTEADAAGLFTAIPAVPGSALAFESGGGAFLDRARSVTDFSALWKGGMRDPAGWLSAHGWIPEFHPLEAFARQVGRPISGTTDEGFLTASPSPPAAAPSSP